MRGHADWPKSIGYHTAVKAANLGANVIAACSHSKKQCSNAFQKVKLNKNTSGKIQHRRLDLGSFDDVRRFSNEINQDFERIDILINNAARLIQTPNQTKDNQLQMMQINSYSQFLLTLMLLPSLKKSDDGHILFVDCAGVRKQSSLPLNRLNAEDGYDPSILYSYSKSLNHIVALYLFQNLSDSVRINLVDPGIVSTSSAQAQIAFMFRPIFSLIFNGPKKGCDSVINVIASDKCARKSGKLFKYSKAYFDLDQHFPDEKFNQSILNFVLKCCNLTKTDLDEYF